ncbi:MAG TPA: efflux RND transporter periplasmic adaptor subunit [Armatimonadota bacterium]|nr:efflux RND transporter periplasmic adaptor subunit [Armatimonadota bacterium]
MYYQIKYKSPGRVPEPALLQELTHAALASAAAALIAVGLAGCSASRSAAPAARAATPPSASTRLISINDRPALELDPASLRLAGLSTVTAGVQDLRETLQLTGQIAATDSNTVQVTSRLPGKIVQALVSVGSRVQKGQLIASVDSVDLTQAEAAYQTALSHERLTYDQLEQQRKLAGYGALSEQPIEDAKRAYAAAQAAAASDVAQIGLDRTTLANTRQLVNMGEITRKPVEDAQNAFAQAQSARIQAEVTERNDKTTLDRAQTLFDAGIFSKQQLEDAQTAYSNAVAAVTQSSTQEKLANEELSRQRSIFQKNLNGSSSLQGAQSKLQQDEHTYQNDLTTQSVTRTELARAEAVHRSGIPVSQALQQAEDAYDEARIALQGAAGTLKLYGVTPGQGIAQLQNGHVIIPVAAPLSGIVVARNMVVGQMADTSTPLVKIENLNQVYVDAQVFEKDLASVAVGDPIQAHASAFPDRVFTGRVAYVGDEVDPDTRTITVRTEVANPDWALRPGMFASVLIGSGAGVRGVAIPSSAVLQEGNSQVVYVQVSPRVFVKRVVKLGDAVGGSVPVLSGVAPGDRVVVNGNVLLETEQSKLASEKGSAA